MKYIDADKIRAEIKKRLNWKRTIQTSYYMGCTDELNELLSFLDTLEEPEEELMKEVKRYYSENFSYITSDNPTLSILTNIARHFAEWGAGHTPLPEDTVIFQKGVEEGKRLMMEGAVEGEIQMRYSGCLCAKTIRAINEDKFKFGDKVRIIIIKED